MDRQNLEIFYLHPEEEPNVDEINNALTNIDKDLKYIDNNFIECANNLQSLLISTKNKILNIKDKILAEKGRQEDINILCNKYSNFSSVININQDNTVGNLSFTNDILHAAITSKSKIDYSILNIDGNGFEGNKYVYNNGKFLSDVIDTSLRENIESTNLAVSYEYSRITCSNKKDLPSIFANDSIEAECTLEIETEENINELMLYSERNDLVLKEIYYSIDGGLTYNLDKEYNIEINNKDEKYNNQTYIYGSGIISVPEAQNFKIVLRSNGTTSDSLAYIQSFATENEITKKIKLLPEANRHVIKINSLSAYKVLYSKGSLTSKEIVTDSIKNIALYCNEYIKNGYNIGENVSYYLIVNGQEYPVVPINSNRNGKKIIKTSSQNYKSDLVSYINEDIKSAKLKIVIPVSAEQDVSPYISNIKILIGGE